MTTKVAIVKDYDGTITNEFEAKGMREVLYEVALGTSPIVHGEPIEGVKEMGFVGSRSADELCHYFYAEEHGVYFTKPKYLGGGALYTKMWTRPPQFEEGEANLAERYIKIGYLKEKGFDMKDPAVVAAFDRFMKETNQIFLSEGIKIRQNKTDVRGLENYKVLK